MALKVRYGGVNRTIASLKVKHLGAIRAIRTLKHYSGGVVRTVANFSAPLELSVDPASQNPVSSISTCNSVGVTATPAGGYGPYSYSWAVTTYQGALPSILLPAFATTQFSQAGLSAGEDNFCTFTCTVTDSLGTTATAVADVTFARDSGA